MNWSSERVHRSGAILWLEKLTEPYGVYSVIIPDDPSGSFILCCRRAVCASCTFPAGLGGMSMQTLSTHTCVELNKPQEYRNSIVPIQVMV